MIPDYVKESGTEHFHEWGFYNYIENMLNEWYGRDGVQIYVGDTVDKYFENNWVDVTRESMESSWFGKFIKCIKNG